MCRATAIEGSPSTRSQLDMVSQTPRAPTPARQFRCRGCNFSCYIAAGSVLTKTFDTTAARRDTGWNAGVGASPQRKRSMRDLGKTGAPSLLERDRTADVRPWLGGDGGLALLLLARLTQARLVFDGSHPRSGGKALSSADCF